MKTCSSASQVRNDRRAAACCLFDVAHSLRRAGRYFSDLIRDAPRELDLVTLSRVRGRVDGLALLLSEAAKNLKLISSDKNFPLVRFQGQLIGLQEASRYVRAIRNELKEVKVGEALPGSIATLAFSNAQQSGFEIPYNIDLSPWRQGGGANGNFNPFNRTDDDEARKLVSQSSCEQLRSMPPEKLVTMIRFMLDGPTGDDDEMAILKIIECLEDCGRRTEIVKWIGIDRLLSDIDGTEWDRLVILLVKCRIISFATMDDDASRRFVDSHSCAQLGQLDIGIVRQLILNMFAGGTGDDDENAILKLLRCQSTPRLHQLVGMPGTDVGEFNYQFDGDEWDDLEAFFALNGITLDP